MNKSRTWYEIFDVLTSYSVSQEQCEAATNDVMKVVNNIKKEKK